MTSYVCDCGRGLRAAMMMMTMTVTMMIMLLLFINGISASSSMAADHHLLLREYSDIEEKAYNLLELTSSSSSREEMVEMAGYGEAKLSTVLVTGNLVCEACHLPPRLHAQPQLRAWPISDAKVTVRCESGCTSKSSCLAEGRSDEYGDFIIDVPSHLHGIPNLEKLCTVKVVGIPKKSRCRPALVKKNKALRLSSVGNGIRTYTAGRIRFQHITSKPSKACIHNKAKPKQQAMGTQKLNSMN